MDKLNERQKVCLEFVASLPIQMEKYRQDQGMYTDSECGCCVGAYAAKHFGVAVGLDAAIKYRQGIRTIPYADFKEGARMLLEKLGYAHETDLHADLEEMGAPMYPFGAEEWEVHPRKVFIRLAYEKLAYEKLAD